MSISLQLFFALFLFWAAPFVMVATSKRSSGIKKILWLLSMVFVSWFAWLLYLVVTSSTAQTSIEQKV